MAVLGFALFCLARSAPAATLHVPADHATVQAGIVAAASGDTVLVGPGTYAEYILLKAGLVLKSSDGPESTTLVSAGLEADPLTERVLEIEPGAGRETVVEGFSFDPAGYAGTAIFCEKASPTIRGNVIDGGFGWGLSLREGDALVDGNMIANCNNFGISVFAGSPEIVRNTLKGCSPRAIDVVGVKSHPVIGGAPGKTNKFLGNDIDIVLSSMNDIDATYNDWGWAITSEMEMRPFPTDISSLQDGNDLEQSNRGRGQIDYRHWITADGGSEASGAPRWLLPALAAVGILLVVVVALRR